MSSSLFYCWSNSWSAVLKSHSAIMKKEMTTIIEGTLFKLLL